MNALVKIVSFALACQIVSAISLQDEARLYGVLWNRHDPNEKLFYPFCDDAHNFVLSDIRKSVCDTSACLYTQFFGSVNDLADELLSIQREASSALAAQIADPEKPIPDEPLPGDEVIALIEKGKREIQEKSSVAGIIPGVKSTAAAMANVANTAFFRRLAVARSYFSASSLVSGLRSSCEKVDFYEKSLENKLESYKAQLAAEHSEPDVQEFISAANLNSLRCSTTKNVVRLSAFCELAMAGHSPFMKMLGISGH